MDMLETDRLLLREWQPADLDDLYAYASNPNVGTMAGWKPHNSKEDSVHALKSFIESGDTWAVALKESGKVIGQIRIYPDENRGSYSTRNSAKLISYALSEAYWGKGFMTEAVKCVVQYAFDELGAELLSVFHFPHNTRTRRVIEKCGFQYETTIEQGYQCYNGQIFDSICYSISKAEYYSA